nr:putative ribonuclease H-like domain-containing protein [Tanacetum cinerariifolium]
MFDLDYLTNSMNSKPVSVENQANKSAGPKKANNSVGTQANDDQGANSEEIDLHDEYFVLTICSLISTASPSRALNDDEPSYPDDPSMPHLEDIYASPSKGIFTDSSYDDKGMITDFNNLETTVNVNPTPITRIHTIHPKTQILGDPLLAVQTRSKVNKNFEAHALFKIQKVWILVDLPFGKKAIGTKWVYRNKKDERGVALYGLHQALRAWYAILSTFLEKSRYKRGAIDKTLFIKYDKKDIMLVQVYLDNIIFGSTKKSWGDEFEKSMKNRFQMSSMCELTFFLGLQTASTPIETQKPLVKDKEAADVDVYIYRSLSRHLTFKQ